MTLNTAALAADSATAQLRQERDLAVQQEKDRWAKVKGKYPGQRGHDPDEWQKWQAVANRVQALSQELKAAGPQAPVRHWRGS